VGSRQEFSVTADAYLSLHVRGQGAQLDIIEIKPMDKPMEKPK